MRAVYIPNEDWDYFYQGQAAQSGHGIPGFAGAAYQRGGGIGNFLGRLFRFILPVAKTAAKAVGKQALASGAEIVGDVARGRNFAESAKEHGRDALGALADKTGAYMKQKGSGRLGNRSKTIKGNKTLKRKRAHAGKQLYSLLRDVEIDR